MTRFSPLRLLPCVILLVTVAGAGSAGATSLFYLSPQTTPVCVVANQSSEPLQTLYILQYDPAGTLGSRFKIESGPGITWTYIQDSHPFANTTGNTQTGIAVCYDQCIATSATPIVVASMTYLVTSGNSDGTEILFVPHPDAVTVEAMGCDGVPVASEGVSLVFRAGCEGAECCVSRYYAGTPHAFGCTPPVPTAQSTWGRVKALYR